MSFKDYLEEQMDLKRPCTIKFKDVQGAVTTIKGRIVKWMKFRVGRSLRQMPAL